jgi:hypothetical protein
VIPPGARIVVDHRWAWDALAPDLALDGGQVLLDSGGGPFESVEPVGGWGYRIGRSLGSAFADQPALSGTGDRRTVFDLSHREGETVQLRFEAAGDITQNAGVWEIRGVCVHGDALGEGSLTAVSTSDGGGVLAIQPPSANRPVSWRLYGGAPPRLPGLLVAEGTGEAAVVDRAARPGRARRYDVLWRAGGAADGASFTVTFPPAAAARHLHPFPNPATAGSAQTWSVDVPENGGGEHRFVLVDVRGRLVFEGTVSWTVPGRRSFQWDGRDARGRVPAGGVYFLSCRFPGGNGTARRVVLVP